ncbi:MAG: HlyD family efflux transporter periplasmic adaptor subunit [Acidobacteriota bacterium]
MDQPRDPSILRKKKIRRYALIGAALIVLLAVSAAVANLEPAARVVEKESVWDETVQRGTFVREVRGPGTLVPENIRWIPALREGSVERILVRPGSEVQSTTVLLEMTNPELEQEALDAELRLREAEAQLTNLRARLASQLLDQEAKVYAVEADLGAAKLQKEADEELFEAGLIPDINLKRSRLQNQQLSKRHEIEQQRLEKISQSNDAQIASEQAKVDQLRSLFQLRRKQLDALKVTAGLDGVLQELPLEVGQRVTPGELLARVAQPDTLKAELRIPETQAKDVAVSQTVVVDTRNGKAAGEVTRIDPAVQDGYVLVDVAFTEDLPNGARPDLSVDGTIEIERLEDVLYVGRPTRGQRDSTIQLYKMIDDGREAVAVTVQLGRTSVNTVEVVSGLEEGDRVILSDPSEWEGADRIRLR